MIESDSTNIALYFLQAVLQFENHKCDKKMKKRAVGKIRMTTINASVYYLSKSRC